MAREVLFRVRLSDEEFEKLEAFARSSKRQKSEVIRDYIKRMPDPKPDPGLKLPPE